MRVRLSNKELEAKGQNLASPGGEDERMEAVRGGRIFGPSFDGMLEFSARHSIYFLQRRNGLVFFRSMAFFLLLAYILFQIRCRHILLQPHGHLTSHTFLMKHLCVKKFEADRYATAVKQLAPDYQSYLADLAISGDPNKHTKNVKWNNYTVGADCALENVLLVSLGGALFQSDFKDKLKTKDICSFWTQVSKNMTKELNRSQIDEVFSLRKQSWEL